MCEKSYIDETQRCLKKQIYENKKKNDANKR